MFTGHPVHTHESGTTGGIIRRFTASSLCISSKEPRPDRTAGDGVSTYLALTFGTLLSYQGTDASFVLTLSGFPPGASLRCFRLYQILSASDSQSEGVVFPAVGPFRRLKP